MKYMNTTVFLFPNDNTITDNVQTKSCRSTVDTGMLNVNILQLYINTYC